MWNWNADVRLDAGLLLAQGDGGPQLGGGGADGGGAGATGDPAGAGGGAAARPATDTWTFMLPILLVFGLVIVWSMFRQRREQKKRDQLLSAIKKRDRVQTIGGVIGSVVEVKSNIVVLKVDESSNTRMTFARTAIQQILTDAPDSAKNEESVEVKAE